LFALRETWELPLVEALVGAFKSGGLEASTRAGVLEVISDVARKEPPWDGTWWNTGGNPAARARPARTRDWEGTAAALSALHDALRETEPGIRSLAIAAVRRFKDTNAAPVLRDLLHSETDTGRSKELLAALAEIGGNGFVEELRQLVDDAVQGKSSPGFDALLTSALDAVLDPASGPELLRLAQSKVRPEWRIRAISALGRVPDRSMVSGVRTLLADKEAAIVSAAIEALPRMDADTLAQEAARFLKDPRLEVRRAVVRALAASPDPTALEPLNDALGDLSIRDDVVKVLATQPSMAGFNAYVAGLASKDSATVDAAVNALLAIQGEAWLKLETGPLLQSIPAPVLQRLAGGSRNHPFNQMLVLGPLEDGPHDFGELVQAAAANRPYGGPATWQQAQSRPLSGRIPLREVLKLTRPNPRQVAFALLPLNVPSVRQIILSIEADDLRGVVLNGQDVLGSTYTARDGPRKFREFATPLAAGQNLLLVTVGLGEVSPVLSLSWTLNAPLRQATDTSPEAFASFATTMAGSEKNGESVFHNSRNAGCARCHRVGSLGGSLGPALDGVGSKLNRAQLVEAVLYPSRQILHGFQQVTITRKNGDHTSGLLVRDDADVVWLVDSAGATNVIKSAEVANRKASDVSLMPEGLHAGLTPQEFADLISYMQGLK
jgi:putative heme-binding domain-containing protein